MDSKALVVLSGGQDSTTCLFLAKKGFDEVITVSFDYGQRHKRELECAQKIATLADVEHEIIKLDFLNVIAANALTRTDMDVSTHGPDGLPNTFVDGRNLFFMAIAAVIAKKRGINVIYTGACQTDYSGYPDCRREFFDSLEKTLRLAMNYKVTIRTPLMYLTKAQSVEAAQRLGPKCMAALAISHTCYNGVEGGCGHCPACILRAKGFQEAGVPDPILATCILKS